MTKSKVYFTDFKTEINDSHLKKLARLVKQAGIDTIDMKDKFVAIKIHFGEPGNLAFLRPNYARTIVDIIKENGGKPFLTDCNTLYVGGRKNALDHIDSAYQNGYSPFSTGCHILIGDGLKGTDESIIPINQECVKEAKIGRAVMDSDIFISLTHFKGHESTGFGGALKNIGMGCGSRAGKFEMHSSGKPIVDENACRTCGQCIKQCAHDALHFNENKKAHIDTTKCAGCGRCIGACGFDAISTIDWEANDILNKKIAEYTLAVVQDKPCFHISVVCDVSPNCDCHAENDIPIIADVGMFASFDPVALDQACADACLKSPIIEGSILSKHEHHHHDPFKDTHPDTNWEICVEHAEKIGLGSREYELVVVK